MTWTSNVYMWTAYYFYILSIISINDHHGRCWLCRIPTPLLGKGFMDSERRVPPNSSLSIISLISWPDSGNIHVEFGDNIQVLQKIFTWPNNDTVLGLSKLDPASDLCLTAYFLIWKPRHCAVMLGAEQLTGWTTAWDYLGRSCPEALTRWCIVHERGKC